MWKQRESSKRKLGRVHLLHAFKLTILTVQSLTHRILHSLLLISINAENDSMRTVPI